MKTYIVPVVVTGQFGCEVEVRAKNKKEAIAKALAGKGTFDDGFDWDRWSETGYAIGDWQPVEEFKDV